MDCFNALSLAVRKTYDNKEWVDRMVTEQEDMRIPTELIPKCPVCGKPMTMNLRSDNRFVEDSGWHKAAERYTEFFAVTQNEPILFLELGVGFSYPQYYQISVWQMAAQNPKRFMPV